MGSGFTGDWDGRRPPVHARPPDPPLSLEGLETAARVLQDEHPDWMVWAAAYPKLRLIAQEWPRRPGGRWIMAKTLGEARSRIAGDSDEGENE